jgi:hypothetical protein
LENKITIVQLPFPSLNYFPDRNYFSRLEQWYRSKVSVSVKVPDTGIWEVPMWISWIKAFCEYALSQLSINAKVDVLDLNAAPYDSFRAADYFPESTTNQLFLFSPLLQNYVLAESVSAHIRSGGGTTMLGGVMAEFANAERFDAIFKGRLEHNALSFIKIMSQFLRVKSEPPTFALKDIANYLSYEWAKNYSDRVIFLRLFTHFGCPLSCTFCADRKTAIDILPSYIMQRELKSLSITLPRTDALYIGDLTFGANKASIASLRKTLDVVQQTSGIVYKLIVQTNPSLITQEFLNELKTINVKVIELGIESGSPEAVQRVSKKRPSSDWLEKKLQLILDNGFSVAGNIIVGLPHDRRQDYDYTLDFIRRWKNNMWFNIYGYVPYLNTPLFKQLSDDNRIRNWNFSDWCEGKDLVFEPYFIRTETVREYFHQILRETR